VSLATTVTRKLGQGLVSPTKLPLPLFVEGFDTLLILHEIAELYFRFGSIFHAFKGYYKCHEQEYKSEPILGTDTLLSGQMNVII